MITGLLKKIFGSRNTSGCCGYYMHSVRAVQHVEAEIARLSDDALKARTAEFKQRATPTAKRLISCCLKRSRWCAKAGKRVLQMRHFDVQIIGGIALHQGKIAEMRTGEGKTLVATLPAYLNALSGKGVHVVTVNDYLAKRDSRWMGACSVSRSHGRRNPVADGPWRQAGRIWRRHHAAPITNSGSIICATTWRRPPRNVFSAASITRSSTRWTRS